MALPDRAQLAEQLSDVMMQLQTAKAAHCNDSEAALAEADAQIAAATTALAAKQAELDAKLAEISRVQKLVDDAVVPPAPDPKP